VSRLQEVAEQRLAMETIVTLTSVFEGLASMRIAQVKNQVLQSQEFFSEIWHMYQQIRVDSLFRFGRTEHEEAIKKQLYIVITAEVALAATSTKSLLE